MLFLAVPLGAHVRECACDVAKPETLEARASALCREAEAQPAEPPIFFLKDNNPRKPNRWLGRVGVSINNAREHFASAAGRYDTNGNPTPTVAEPLVDGGQFAPVSSPSSGSGNIYINAKWQLNANGTYVAPLGIEASANVFGRQGYPFPLFRTQALGGESLGVLVTPRVDYLRYDQVWDTDVRAARTFKLQGVSLRVIGDVFNLFNANTVLIRNNNILSTSFNQIAQNLSPRIVRLGVVVGF